MKKAQASVEFLYAVGIILLFFLLILAFTYDKNNELKETEDFLNKQAECNRISNILTNLLIQGRGTEIKITSNYNISVFNNSEIVILPENITCFYLSDIVDNTELTSNEILISNVDEQVVVANA